MSEPAPAHGEHGGGGHEAAAEQSGGGGLWKKLTAPVTSKMNQLYGKGKQKFTSILDPREGAAQSTGFLRGDIFEAGYDALIGATLLNTKDKVVEVLQKGGSGLENTMLQAKKAFGTTPITSPVKLAGNIIKLPIVAGVEGADFVASGIGTGYQWLRDGVEGAILRPVDLISTQARQKLAYIPVVGNVLGIGVSGTLNVMNKLISTPLKVTDWIRGKVGAVLDWSFNKVRKHTIDEAGHTTAATHNSKTAHAPAAHTPAAHGTHGEEPAMAAA